MTSDTTLDKPKIIQIATSMSGDGNSALYILLSDGRLFYRGSYAWQEEKIPDFSQPTKKGNYWIEDIDSSEKLTDIQ